MRRNGFALPSWQAADGRILDLRGRRSDVGIMRTRDLIAVLMVLTAAPTRAEPAAAAEEDDEPVASDESAHGCVAEPVSLQRSGFQGPVVLSLTDCAGHPNLEALPALSLLAQPPSARTDEGDSGAGTQAHPLNPELLVRLQRIASEFPGHAIEIVSGYRPTARPGSRHHGGDALDLRVEGVDNTELVAVLRSLAATGVGYYPNSTFVHVDVRKDAFYWVDRSAPGEAPSYVAEPAAEPPTAGSAGVATGAETVAAEATAAAPEAESGPSTVAPSEPSTVAASEPSAIAESEPSLTSELDAAQAAAQGDRATQAELDAELRSLADRALVVMNLALGRTTRAGSALPDRAEL
jgi:hypothetical protein